ncbi:MAG: response regulator transcription factor, partial [Anaerolineales bacterium]|nr:response regulator transcription factor [Anaerolineales bacterium]
ELFREGLAGLVNAQPDLIIVGQAGDGLEALTMARDLQLDLIVMDINMPICDGLEATRLIRETLSDVRIVILTVHDKDEKLFAAIKAGANGYMLKDTNSTDFLVGVRGALGGEATLPPKLAASLLDEYARLAAQSTPPPSLEEDPDLTSRELEVLNLIATGASNQEIADALSISLHTTKSHVRNILAKMHAVNRRHAARLAAQRGLLGDVE